MPPITAPITRYFGHDVHIHVAIFRDVDCRRLNLECGLRAYPGVEWDRPSQTLIFSGKGLEECERNAEEFYEYIVRSDYKRIAARIRHRMGRNGHGWPVDRKQAAETQRAVAFLNAARQRFL